MTDHFEKFAEVYSVSDLHLADGAAVDTRSVTLLAKTVRALAARAKALKGRKAALVINGDAVDFLSVAPATYFDPQGAPEKLERVFKANESVWQELDAFSRVGTVVFTLGNHDVELALPSCQAMLRQRVAGSLILAFDGAGYRCKVGNATALFVHGNNEDGWNIVDFDRLGRTAAALNSGTAPEPWEPNDGTRLVIEVLNAQKADHPFIDYVKPESFWLLELIAKLGFGSLAAQIAEIGPRQFSMRRNYARHAASPQAVYLGSDAGGRGGATLFDGDELLRRADERYRRGERVLSGDTGSGSLGGGDVFRSKPVSDPNEIRQHILKSLRGDTTFIHNQKRFTRSRHRDLALHSTQPPLLDR